MENNYNNNFFGYNGYINRKNYTINMLILFALYVSTLLVNFETFVQFTNYKFLLTILLFLVNFFQFIILISSISVIYRRIADISRSRSIDFFKNAKRIFATTFVFPILYFYCLRPFLSFMPIIQLIDLITVLILLPFGIIILITLCFLKGNNKGI